MMSRVLLVAAACLMLAGPVAAQPSPDAAVPAPDAATAPVAPDATAPAAVGPDGAPVDAATAAPAAPTMVPAVDSAGNAIMDANGQPIMGVPGEPVLNADGTARLDDSGNPLMFPAAMAPTPVATPAPAPAAEEATPHAKGENPYGLKALWNQGDFVAKGTLIIMVIMSFFTWFIALTKIWEQRNMESHAGQAEKNFWQSSSIQSGVGALSKGSPFRYIAEEGIRAQTHHDGKMTDQIDLHEWISMSLNRAVDSVNNRLQGGLAFLASVGSTAPFIGLFGTVWGIYHALIAIGVAGQASIDKVAGPVGEALIMTAIGLAVAVPAVLFYNMLVRRNKVILERLRNFSSDLHALLLSGSRVTGQAAGGRR